MPATKIHNKLLHNLLIKLQIHHLIQHINIHINISTQFPKNTIHNLFTIHLNNSFNTLHIKYIFTISKLNNFIILLIFFIVLFTICEIYYTLCENCADTCY